MHPQAPSLLDLGWAVATFYRPSPQLLPRGSSQFQRIPGPHPLATPLQCLFPHVSVYPIPVRSLTNKAILTITTSTPDSPGKGQLWESFRLCCF